jgi:hypothetical protein
VRNQKNSRASDNYEDGIAMWARPLLWAGGTLLSRPRDSALAIAAGVAAGAIVINSLYLQPGPHPAPIFAFKRSPIAADAQVTTGAVANVNTNVVPRPRPVEAASAEPPASQPRAAYVPPPVQPQAAAPRRDKDPIAELLGASAPQQAPTRVATAPVPPAAIPQVTPAVSLASIQRRLAEFGYGPVAASGTDGPETRAAIERFERGHGMSATGKVSERLTRELAAMSGRPL